MIFFCFRLICQAAVTAILVLACLLRLKVSISNVIIAICFSLYCLKCLVANLNHSKSASFNSFVKNVKDKVKTLKWKDVFSTRGNLFDYRMRRFMEKVKVSEISTYGMMAIDFKNKAKLLTDTSAANSSS